MDFGVVMCWHRFVALQRALSLQQVPWGGACTVLCSLGAGGGIPWPLGAVEAAAARVDISIKSFRPHI